MRRGLLALAVSVLLSLSAAALLPIGARAQGIPPIRVYLYGTNVEWDVPGGALVDAALLDGGRLVGMARTQAYPHTGASIDLRAGMLRSAAPIIRPGTTLVLTATSPLVPNSGQPITLTVPMLLVDVDAASDVVAGLAPPGEAVEIVLREDPGSSATPGALPRLVASATGTFITDTTGVFDIRPGNLGEAALTTPEGHRFIARFAPLTADLILGHYRVEGTAPIASFVNVEVAGADGGRCTSSSEVLLSWHWGATLACEGRSARLAPGDRVTVAQGDRLVPGAAPPPTATLPVLDLEYDRLTRGAVITTTLATTVALRVDTPREQPIEYAVPWGGSPRRAVDLTALGELPDGTELAVVHDFENGITVRRVTYVECLLFHVYNSDITGISGPNQPFTLTRTAADGTVLGRYEGFTLDAGYVSGGLQRMMPGDRIQLEMGHHPPTVHTVPLLTSRTDGPAATVTGIAPPGARLAFTYTPRGAEDAYDPVTAGISTTADAAGHYTLRFPSAAYTGPGQWGQVILRTPDRHDFYMDWVVPRLDVEIGAPALDGRSVPGLPLAVDLLAPDGRWKAGARREIVAYSESPLWGRPVFLLDAERHYTPIAPGDTISMTGGLDRLSFVVPDIELEILPGTDVVRGTTTVGEPVTVTVAITRGHPIENLSERAERAVRTGAGGAFEVDFASRFDIRPGDRIRATVTTPDGHRVYRYAYVPGLGLRLDTGDLSGAALPRVPVTATLRGATGARGVFQRLANRQGLFRGWWVHPRGGRILPAPGDQVTAAFPGAANAEPLVMPVPEVTVGWDAERTSVFGRATPGGTLRIDVDALVPLRPRTWNPALLLDRAAWARPEIQADGTYTTMFLRWDRDRAIPTALSLVPGRVLDLGYVLPSGHMASRTRIVPALAVEQGGARLLGFALGGSAVEAEVVDAAGQRLGAAEGSADLNSDVDLVLRSGEAPVASGAGQTIRARLEGEPVEVPLGRFDLTVTSKDAPLPYPGKLFHLRVDGPPSTDLHFESIRRPACSNERRTVGSRSRTTAADGVYDDPYWITILPGDSETVFYRTPNGHFVYRQWARPAIILHYHTARVSGCATPLTAIELRLFNEDNEERGRASVVTDAYGDYDTRFLGPDGLPVTARPTDWVQLRSRDLTDALSVEHVDARLEPGEAIRGSVPRGWNALIEVTRADGSKRWVGPRVEADGSFELTSTSWWDDAAMSFAAGNAGPDDPWEIDEVVSGWAYGSPPGGHYIGVPFGRTSVYLPVGMTGRS